MMVRFLRVERSRNCDDAAPPDSPGSGGSICDDAGDHEHGLEGEFPKRARGHVLEWLVLHREELMEGWNLIRERQAPKPIAGLE